MIIILQYMYNVIYGSSTIIIKVTYYLYSCKFLQHNVCRLGSLFQQNPKHEKPFQGIKKAPNEWGFDYLCNDPMILLHLDPLGQITLH